MFAHLPYLEVARLLLKLRRNQHFIRISRILVLSLLALSALGCAAGWGSAPGQDSLLCKVANTPCYQGPTFGLVELVFGLGASVALLFLPLIFLLSSLLILLNFSRAYLLTFLLGWTSWLILLLGGEPHPPMRFVNDFGWELMFYSTSVLCLLGLPLAMAEQMRLHPERDYFAGIMGVR